MPFNYPEHLFGLILWIFLLLSFYILLFVSFPCAAAICPFLLSFLTYLPVSRLACSLFVLGLVLLLFLLFLFFSFFLFVFWIISLVGCFRLVPLLLSWRLVSQIPCSIHRLLRHFFLHDFYNSSWSIRLLLFPAGRTRCLLRSSGQCPFGTGAPFNRA